MGKLKGEKCVHILFTEETEYTLFYGSVPKGMLKNTNGVFYDSLVDSYLQCQSSFNSMCGVCEK